MSVKKSKIVQVVKNQNNSNELFEQWKKKNDDNIKCSNINCPNYVKSNAYIVTAMTTITNKQNENFIVPLCKECYEMENNSTNQNYLDIKNFGSGIMVKEDMLLKI